MVPISKDNQYGHFTWVFDPEGNKKVTPALVDTLIALDRKQEAIHICARALAISPDDSQLRRLRERIVSNRSGVRKTGRIKKVLHHKKGYLFGFITTDDGSPDIYFNERRVDPGLLPVLTEGLPVYADVEPGELGPRAQRVWRVE